MAPIRIFGARPSDPVASFLRRASVSSSGPTGNPVDLRKYVSYVDDQIGQQCVGEALAGANLVAVKGQGRRASHRGVYVLARSRERDRRTDPLTDEGSQPADAYDAAVAVGLYPLDGRDIDPLAINLLLTWDEVVSATPVPAGIFAPLDDGDLSSVDAALTSEWPCTYTQQVDQSYMDVSESLPVWSGARSTPLGLHRQAVVGRVQVTGAWCYVVWNSWGRGWADSGFAYIPCDAFGRIAHEVVVHQGGVVL